MRGTRKTVPVSINPSKSVSLVWGTGLSTHNCASNMTCLCPHRKKSIRL